MQYIFHLGRLYTISIAELIRIIGEDNIIFTSRSFLIASIDEPLKKENAQTFLDKLGGTMKISKIINKITNPNTISQIAEDYLIENYSYNKKITYGMNSYNIDRNSGIFLDKMLKTIKKSLQSKAYSARFVNKDFNNIEAATVWKEKLNTNEGSELNVININQDIYLTETIAIQNINDYSIRDFEKPFRDSKTGMLPPKLAQILINLAVGDERLAISQISAHHNYIIDPFCGSGTILMEGLLMGRNVIGSDISEEQVAGALTNINWLKQNSEISDDCSFDVQIQDVTRFNIDKKIAKKSSIASEGYLGDPLKKVPEKQQVEWSFNQILLMHRKFLENASRLGIERIAICLPAYRKDHEYIFVKGFFEMIGKVGYGIEPIFSNNFLQKYPFLFLSKRNTLIYDRDDQVVAREIIVLKILE